MTVAASEPNDDGIYRPTSPALPGVDMAQQIPIPEDHLIEELDRRILEAEQALAVLQSVRKSITDLKASGASHFTPADLNLPL